MGYADCSTRTKGNDSSGKNGSNKLNTF